MRFRTAILTISFVLFLYPVSFGELGVNYSFLFLPLLCFVSGRGTRRPSDKFIVLMGLFSLIFVLAVLYQFELIDVVIRRMGSFVIFMSIFSYMFLRIDREMIAAFKVAVVLISLYLSLRSAYHYFALGGASLGFEAKDVVGTQRIGFLYLMAIWLVYLEAPRDGGLKLALKYGALLTLLAGLFLTFSRSSIVALLGSVVSFAIASGVSWFKRPGVRKTIDAVAWVGVASLLIVMLQILVPVTFEFFKSRLFDPTEVIEHLQDQETSEGVRVRLASRIVEYVMRNPLTGSGYLGIWVLPDIFSGSAHNQYTDVLLRTGVFGFCAYVYLLLLLLSYLHTKQRALFWGFVGVLIYGLFHETFKESQGGFILAFLLGMMSSGVWTLRARRAQPPEAGVVSRQHETRGATVGIPRSSACLGFARSGRW